MTQFLGLFKNGERGKAGANENVWLSPGRIAPLDVAAVSSAKSHVA
jgi:hypothetical protein